MIRLDLEVLFQLGWFYGSVWSEDTVDMKAGEIQSSLKEKYPLSWWDQSGAARGFLGRLGRLHLWRFPRCEWMSLRAIWSDLKADPAGSTELDKMSSWGFSQPEWSYHFMVGCENKFAKCNGAFFSPYNVDRDQCDHLDWSCAMCSPRECGWDLKVIALLPCLAFIWRITACTGGTSHYG